MSEAQGSAELVEAFYTAYNDTSGLRAERLAACESIAAALRARGERDLASRAWALLFDGILANEQARDWGAGERLFRAALSANRGADRLLDARANLALGVTCGYLDRWPESIEFCRRALAALDGLDKPIDVAAAWTNMAIACGSGYAAGAYGPRELTEGVGYCGQALAALDAMPETRERRSLAAYVWNTLGNLENYAGHWQAAITAYERHQAICRDAGYPCRAAISYDNLGQVYEQLGESRYAEAAAAYETALRTHAECGDAYHEALSRFSLAGLTAAQGRAAEALDGYLRCLDQLEALRTGVSSAESRAGFFATAASAFAQAILLARQTQQPELAFDLAERSRARATLDMLALGNADPDPAQAGSPLPLAEMQSRLAERDLLLCYFTTGLIESREPHRGAAPRFRFPPRRAFLFAVTRSGIVARDLEVSPQDLAAAPAVSANPFLDPRARRRLYDRLLAPVSAALADCRRLFIVPHGPLHSVPFAALLAPDGETLLREGGPELIFGLSATALFAAPPRPERPAADADRAVCLAIGYNGGSLHPLRYAEDEAAEVAGLTRGQAVIGPIPKAALLTGAPVNARWLHISCHGQFDAEAPLASGLLVGPDEWLAAQDVLAAARLTCELVTLSACESGRSRVRRGDELIGLARAFLAAGARAVLVTLWQVDEQSTRLLMAEFYRGLLTGLSAPAALRQAQLRIRREYADPFYWAPFILIATGQT